ncbi:MAG: hypothetical protein HY936_09420 [Nitrosomonadales bacterium]|nr:hypothetical protein [Nitrosomonadales bacterium]
MDVISSNTFICTLMLSLTPKLLTRKTILGGNCEKIVDYLPAHPKIQDSHKDAFQDTPQEGVEKISASDNLTGMADMPPLMMKPAETDYKLKSDIYLMHQQIDEMDIACC